MAGIVAQPRGAKRRDQRSSDEYALKPLMAEPALMVNQRYKPTLQIEQADAKRHSLNGQYPPKGIFKTTLKKYCRMTKAATQTIETIDTIQRQPGRN
ncbi:hypothetical protein [Paraburkholderia sp. J63]|uniref:hypothetical protein n=1 Tax=Paraburkholderia sp. J63 TaxID=2805434 RepID=UPI002ABE47E6|nr:hypothetical protein [Paraburkholderia sp. J63]